MREIDESKYVEEIKKLKRKQRTIFWVDIIALIIIVFSGGPLEFEFMGSVIEYQGIGFFAMVALIILCTGITVIASAISLMPLNTSMLQECDPEKNLALNKALNKGKHIDNICAMDYFYLGHYEDAIIYSGKGIESHNEAIALTSLFNKARGLFFLEGYEAFYKVADEYEAKLLSCKKLKPKVKNAYEGINNVLYFMRAIAQNDTEKMNELLKTVKPWNTSKPTEYYVNYIKGLAAYKLNDTEEAIFRFKTVKEGIPSSALSDLADNYLLLIKSEDKNG